MKNFKFLLLSAIIIVNTSFGATQISDRIVAIVNNDAILESDINTLTQFIKCNLNKTSKQSTNENVLSYQKILKRLIDNQIILQIGKKIGVSVSDKYLNEFIKNIKKQNNISITDGTACPPYCKNIDYTTYRDQIYKEILISKIRNNEVNRRIIIRPQEIDALADLISNQNNDNTVFNLSYIFVPLLDNSISKINKTGDLVNSIVKLARNNSNNIFNKSIVNNTAINHQILKYKQISWISIRDLPFIFVQALITAKKGDIIGPIRSNSGFHILKVNDLHNYGRNLYNIEKEIHIRHILLKPSPVITENQVKTKLKQILICIKNNKITFADAAKKFSQDPNSANRGGDLGWINENIYNSSLYNVLTHLNKNQISYPVRSSIGWHLIELLDIRKINKTDKFWKEKAFYMLFNYNFLKEEEAWIQEQRINNYIKILDK